MRSGDAWTPYGCIRMEWGGVAVKVNHKATKQKIKHRANIFYTAFVHYNLHQPSAISHQPSAISHQPSAISHHITAAKSARNRTRLAGWSGIVSKGAQSLSRQRAGDHPAARPD